VDLGVPPPTFARACCEALVARGKASELVGITALGRKRGACERAAGGGNGPVKYLVSLFQKDRPFVAPSQCLS
jgi:hypothetical protein